ncbi:MULTISPECIES: DUF6507 family protein [Thermomonosporaceae]|uniref:DUF6507 family protein n=1 Tax=Thermomonosporaceae TaxID=2012 RepID=UPI00255AD5E2|nr:MULTISPECIES: DUF6507 family protein [Thermomonosporaceae]MDL4773659.1 DUF6507 family protein [Actinomadura xylanilytica]
MSIPGWNIDVAGVRSAQARTIAAIEPLQGYAETYGEALWSAGYATGSDRITQALDGFGEHHRHTLPLAAKRTSNCIRGATLATNAYLSADEEMAARAQHNATIAPRPDQLGKPHK